MGRLPRLITGPGGHSWANFGRPNPANALGRIVAKLADLDVPSNPDTNRTSYNVGRIGGGTSVSDHLTVLIYMIFA